MSIIGTVLQLKAILFGAFSAIIAIFFIRRDCKNEIKNQGLEAKIKESKRAIKSKNDFNDLDDAAQSDWVLKNLKKRKASNRK